jgi:NAD(P)-dependent dehydrogenase (short-subunit alcohol dehydrogenase family)
MVLFKDQVSIVTGAASGMGRELAKQLAQAGSHVAICDVNKDMLEETRQVIKSESPGVDCRAYIVDVSSKEKVFEFRDKVMADFGRVNIIFNNAGIAAEGKMIYDDDMTKEDIEKYERSWDKTMDVNFYGVVYMCRAFIPIITKQKHGAICNTSSVNGFWTWPEHTCYTASKAAVKGFTESLMCEMMLKHPHIKVIAIHPGGVSTNIIKDALIDVKPEDAKAKSNVDWIFANATDLYPHEAAEWILDGVKKDKTYILVGYDALGIDLMCRFSARRQYAM